MGGLGIHRKSYTKVRTSADFELRSPAIQNPFQTQSANAFVARTRAGIWTSYTT